MAEKRKKGYKVYAEKKKVFIYPDATNEEKEVVAHYESVLGYAIFLGKRQQKEEKVDTAEKIDLENINAENAWNAYNKISKEEMYNYIEEHNEDLKAFAVASHKPVKKKDETEEDLAKRIKTNEDGEPMYYHISAKRYFFETYFKELWDNQIKDKLNAKNKKTDKIGKEETMEQKLLELLK